MKEWACISVGHHRDIPKAIKDMQEQGWILHTYTCAQMRPGLEILHYLLFEKGE